MKNLIFVLLIIIQPLIVCAQTKADAERVMGRFMTFYNAGQNDSLYNLFSADDRDFISQALQKMRESAGDMTSLEYLGIDTEDPNPGLYVFVTTWSKGGKKTTSFTLDKEKKFDTFRLWTSSGGINKLLKEKKKN